MVCFYGFLWTVESVYSHTAQPGIDAAAEQLMAKAWASLPDLMYRNPSYEYVAGWVSGYIQWMASTWRGGGRVALEEQQNEYLQEMLGPCWAAVMKLCPAIAPWPTGNKKQNENHYLQHSPPLPIKWGEVKTRQLCICVRAMRIKMAMRQRQKHSGGGIWNSCCMWKTYVRHFDDIQL